jgi:tetratricopeptide (TPR) repeat protein
MRAPRVASTVLVLLATLGSPIGGRTDTQPSPLQDALAAYLRDPTANARAFLDAARQEGGSVDPVHAIFLGDAALRIGRYRMATELFDAVRATGDPAFAGAAEIGLAWSALGRGRLTDAAQHFESAGSLNPQVEPFADFALALVAAANGAPDGPAALAAAAARPDIDPALREIAPLLDAYARYWTGDVEGAADAFTAFAVAHPDSRYTDDALYAAAQAKLHAGRRDEAQADLESLAADRRGRVGSSSRLLALDGRALLREGMRRDRELGTRILPRRLADLLDGDGSGMARAALAADERARAAHDAPDAHPARTARRGHDPHAATAATPSHRTGDRWSPDVGAGERPGVATVPPSDALPPDGRAHLPWRAIVAIAVMLVGVLLWLLGRTRTAPANSR